MSADSGLFEHSPIPPLGGSTEFSLQFWNETRDAGIAPSSHSGYTESPEDRLDFLTGAALMGLHLVEPADARAWQIENPKLKTIKPQQLQIVDTLAADFDTYGVEIPRRGSKTTTILCIALGRCARRPGYEVTFSAQSGVKGTARLREWKTTLDLVNPPPIDDRYAPRVKRAPQRLALFGPEAVPTYERPDRGFRILMGEVGKGIYFANGSKIMVLKPEASAYRGEAADLSWLDEAQEIDPDDGAELIAGILPLLDTKEGASIVISGTAGEARAGLFWDAIKQLRDQDPDVGGIDYAVPEDTPWEAIEDETSAMALIAGVHPGINTLTTMEKMRKNWRKMSKPKWAREYLSFWPESFGVKAIDKALWDSRGLQRKKTKPTRVAFAMAIKPKGSVAAFAVAWRDARGVAYVEIVNHQLGTQWLPKRGAELCKTYRGSTIAYDVISSEASATVQEMMRMTPKPKVRKQTWPELAAGCVQFMRDLESGNLKHFNQTMLNNAADIAAKREVRGETGQWLWGVEASGGDITPIIAATNALRNWDQHFARRATAGTATPIMGD